MKKNILTYKEYHQLFESDNISTVILQLLKQYQQEGYGTPQQINNGNCDDFGYDLLALLGSDAEEIRSRSFADEDIDGEIFYTQKTVEDNNLKWPTGYTEDEINSVGLPVHMWVLYKDKHYDAETPNGVANWYELPIFQRELSSINKT